MTGHSSIQKAVEATKQGAFYFVAKPFDSAEMLPLVAKALERRRLLAETSDLKRQLAEHSGFGEILGSALSMKRMFELLESVAGSDAAVLIIGESGTGKELVANALHAKSPRAGGPLVKINCAALPKDLIESELFGHVKGAFTGAAADKPGLLEEAHRGTVLLDEITEMPLDLQAKLLRVLEDRQVRRVGGSRTVPVDFRLLCSTNREPEVAVRDGRLRQDLYFRINTVTVALPSLRDRTGDIPVLAKAFLARFRARHGRQVDGSIPRPTGACSPTRGPATRELEHAIERRPRGARQERSRSRTCRRLRAQVGPPTAGAPAAARWRRSSACPSSGRGVSPAGTSRRRQRSWDSAARRCTPKMRRHGIPQRL